MTQDILESRMDVEHECDGKKNNEDENEAQLKSACVIRLPSQSKELSPAPAGSLKTLMFCKAPAHSPTAHGQKHVQKRRGDGQKRQSASSLLVSYSSCS